MSSDNAHGPIYIFGSFIPTKDIRGERGLVIGNSKNTIKTYHFKVEIHTWFGSKNTSYLSIYIAAS